MPNYTENPFQRPWTAPLFSGGRDYPSGIGFQPGFNTNQPIFVPGLGNITPVTGSGSAPSTPPSGSPPSTGTPSLGLPTFGGGNDNIFGFPTMRAGAQLPPTNNTASPNQSWWEQIIGAAAPALSALSSGRAQGRMQEAAIGLNQDQNNLARTETERRNYQTAIRDQILSQLLGGLRDSNIQAPAGIPMGSVSGGLRPSALGDTSMLAGQLAANARTNLGRPPTTPEPTPIPQAGRFDSILNTIAPILAAAAAFNQGRRP